jgi:hypothetical protein
VQTKTLLATPNLTNQATAAIAILLLVITLILSIPRYWRTRAFYNGLATTLIVAMLFTPFLQAQRAYAYNGRFQARLNPENSNQSPVTSNQYSVTSNQNTNLQSPVSQSPNLLLNSSTITTTVDTDGDGVNDTVELILELCSGDPTNDANLPYCVSVADTTDSDSDGLSDGAEVNQLGTYGDLADSDGDTITDTLEIGGFSYNGQQWYLDPKENDTNKDGLLDSTECAIWVPSNEAHDPNGICPDTDNDGTPDVFDYDNDNDGVPDGRDLSPQSLSTTFDSATPFNLEINNLEVDKPVLVSLQVRPTNPDHLTYMGNVLDWPSPDTSGQIQRRLDTTFANTSNLNIRDTVGFNADYGDMRLTPLLEITIPAAQSHYANLPVKPVYQGIDRTSGMTVTQWLEQSATDPYGLTVMDTSIPGQLTAFLPLTLDTDDTGGGRVAFSTQMAYRPSQGTNGVADWGAAQQFRLIWMVQMITEKCTDPTNNAAAISDPA